MALADADDMINRYDVRTLGDLVSDGDRVGEAYLPTDPKMLAALETASGEVIAACYKGNRYLPADLTGLTGSSAEYLKDLVCRIAFWVLWRRKPWSDRYEKLRDSAEKSATAALDLLRTGQNVFDVAETKEAGTPEVQSVSLVEIQTYNLIVDAARGRFYPARRVTG